MDSAPSIRYIILTNITETSRIYTEGKLIEMEAAFTEKVTVKGSPQVALDIGGQTRYVEFQRAEVASAFFRLHRGLGRPGP